ncbi:MAG: GNAT family N-acetyltransferase [Dermatophilaceae bacterium]
MSDVTVTKNEAQSRWEAQVDGELVGTASYRVAGDSIVFDHTDVPTKFGGRGIAGQLAKASLDDARAQGKKVVPQCSFYAKYIAKNAQYADLT